ncbi:hypothetical protein [Aeromonas hydrophila]|uniref:hypothetical protein n=1 Tax=Aeromonas hydrophila TaxID=644 RepID=UPI001C5A9B65|nr:hypothetical protein [Aeromonas hydrophila]MBW3844970.1 hypothetical protein [Aeromonas hydrophila]
MKIISVTGTVAMILNPKVPLHFKKQQTMINFHNFIITAPINEFFFKTLNILLDSKIIQAFLNQYINDPRKFGSHGLYDSKEMTPERIAILYSLILKKNSHITRLFEEHKNNVSSKLIQGRYADAISLMDNFDENQKKSLWSLSVRTKIKILSRNNESFSEQPKFDNYFCETTYQTAHDKQTAIDADVYLDNAIRRKNREFINAGAFALSGFNALVQLPHPFYEQANSLYSFMRLQPLPLLDLYDRFSEIIKQHYFTLDQENGKVIQFLDSIKSDVNLFHFVSNNEVCLSKDAEHFITLYTEGSYNKIIERLENELHEVEDILTNINLFAKSYIYLNKKPSKNLPSIILSCITQLINIHLYQNTNTAIQQLMSIASKLQPLDIYRHLLISIIKAAPCYFDNETKEKIILSSKFLNHPFHKIDDIDFPAINITSKQDEKTNSLLLKKNSIIRFISEKKYSAAEELLFSYKLDTPINKDFIELMVYNLSKQQDKNKLIGFTASTLIEKPQSYISFPLDDIIEYIKKEEIFNLEAVAITYIYSKNKRQKIKEIFNDTYEAYFLESGIEKFSDILETVEPLTKMQHFLLREICSIENMEYLGIFSEMDLIFERIKIITQLYNISEMPADDFESEFADLVEYIAVSSGAAKLTTAKIFVDCDNIYKQNKPEIDDLLSLHCKINYSNTGSSNDDKLDSETLLADENEDASALNRIAYLLRRDYINHPDFGLDKTLSSEIRHGFFSNLMCSKLQERKLLCELDENGVFVNRHWLEYYLYVNKEITQQIHELLRKFTIQFYHLIEEAEKWMKASIGNDNTSAFNFSFNRFDDAIIASSINIYGIEHYPNYIIRILNDKLDQGLDDIKLRLNVDLADKIDSLFNKLIGDIIHKKQSTSLTDLMDNLNAVQNETKESIRTACEWFSLKKEIVFDPYPIEDLIKLAVRCYSQISPTSIIIKHEIDEGISDIYIPGEHISAIVKTIINFLNNAVYHGTNNDSIIIRADSIPANSSGYIISTTNLVSMHTKKDLDFGKLHKITEKLSFMNSNELLIKEGGSGLYKSKYELLRCDRKFNLKVNCYDNKFTAAIIYEA